MKKKQSQSLGHMLRRIASRIGATVLLEPEWEIVGQITFKSGRHSYFRYNTLDLNPIGSSEIARDKGFANFFMSEMSYPTVPGSKTFYSDEWGKAIGAPRRNIDAGYRHARKLGFPVIVKPNSGSQGAGVALVYNKREFYSAVRSVFRRDRVVLVQRQVPGRDYRLVVLDQKVISAYERVPLNVVSDGTSTIRGLLRAKQRHFDALGRDLKLRRDDPRIAAKLKRQGLSFSSIPKSGQTIYLLDNANLSTGGDSVDVTQLVHSGFNRLAIRLTRDMGLRLCGVDVMVNGDISRWPQTHWILEINAAPGLDHYAKIGAAQRRTVRNLYLKVLKQMEH